MSLYKSLRSAYHAVIPPRLRHAIYERSPGPISRLRRRLVLRLEENAPHDHVYDAAYYDRFVEPTMALSATAMARSIGRDLAPASVIDLGCGTGALLAALREHGITGTGFDYAEAAIHKCRERRLDVHRLDIEHDPIPSIRADVVISTEVAEHLPEACADRFVDALVSMARNTIVLTAAVPSDGARIT